MKLDAALLVLGWVLLVTSWFTEDVAAVVLNATALSAVVLSLCRQERRRRASASLKSRWRDT